MRYAALPLLVSLCWLQPAIACLEHDSTATGWVNEPSSRSWEMRESTHTTSLPQALPFGLTFAALTLVGTLVVMILRRRMRSSKQSTAQPLQPVLAPFLHVSPTVHKASNCSSNLASPTDDTEQEITYFETEYESTTWAGPVHQTWTTSDVPNEHDVWVDSHALTLV